MRDRREEAYRVYVTDSLKALTGASERYYEWIHPETTVPDDPRGSDEIISDIRAGLMARREMEKHNGSV